MMREYANTLKFVTFMYSARFNSHVHVCELITNHHLNISTLKKKMFFPKSSNDFLRSEIEVIHSFPF